MNDRKTPPPRDPDELEPWERRELGLTAFERSELALSRAVSEMNDDPNAAQRTMLEALVEGQHAVYQELRAFADEQQRVVERYGQAAEVLKRHAMSLRQHAGAVADHGAALGSHAKQMDALRSAMSEHVAELKDALRRFER